jgi:predicted nucleotidyltransferase
MKFGLSDKTVVQLKNIFSKYDQITEVILYGSRAKGNYDEGSDIDLAIKGKDFDFSLLQKINNEIDDLLLPYIVDILILNTIENKDIVNHIKRIGKTIYRKC